MQKPQFKLKQKKLREDLGPFLMFSTCSHSSKMYLASKHVPCILPTFNCNSIILCQIKSSRLCHCLAWSCWLVSTDEVPPPKHGHIYNWLVLSTLLYNQSGVITKVTFLTSSPTTRQRSSWAIAVPLILIVSVLATSLPRESLFRSNATCFCAIKRC